MADCPFGTIPCNDGVGCYSWSDLCNGDYRCKDGTDEIAMVSANRFYLAIQWVENIGSLFQAAFYSVVEYLGTDYFNEIYDFLSYQTRQV